MHLDRDFLAISVQTALIAQRIRQVLLLQADALFAIWRLYQDDMLAFADLGTTLQPVCNQVAALLREGHKADAKAKTVCANLLKLESAFWTFFLRVPDVDPTNNAVEHLLTMIATCQQQGHNALKYPTDALVAVLHGMPCPALIAD